MKALGNEQFLNTCVSLTTFLYELYMYQHNNLNKSNERHQLIRWLGIVLDLPGCLKALRNKQCLNTCVSSTTFLYGAIHL